MPRPPIRNGEISDELMQKFDRACELRAKIARFEDELAGLEKRLTWTLMPEAFGEHWGPHSPSPADNALDGARHAPIGDSQLDRDWPHLQRDRQALLNAQAEWKKRRHSA
jgi:hypothetical protein